MTPAPSTRLRIRVAALLVLGLPSLCFASDMTGAAVLVGGVILIACAVLGLAIALILKFGFKRSHHVWWFVPGVPLAAIGAFALYAWQQMDTNLHAGPKLQFLGSSSVTVSKKFGQAELDRAYAKLKSPDYGALLAEYATTPMPELELNLTIQADPDARRFVSVSAYPPLEFLSPHYEAIMFLLEKAVIDSDPTPIESPYHSPPLKKLSDQTPAAKPK